jgi:hypothetical protein
MTDRQDDNAPRYPYDSLAESDDYDEALDELRASGKDGVPHIPTFAESMLERLREVGLQHRTDVEAFANVRKAKMDKGQEIWIRFDTIRDELQGYMGVEVLDVPRADKAILAAMVAWLAQHVDLTRLLEAQQFILSESYEAEEKELDKLLRREGRDARRLLSESKLETWEDHVSAFKALQKRQARAKTLSSMQYIVPLLRYYRPDFDSRSPEEQQDLIEKTCGHVNNFLDSLRKLQEFLQYGVPDQKKLAPPIKNPKRDVRAAVMYDVDELNYRQIGERMRIFMPPERLKEKGDFQTVRKMVERGRRVLIKAFGEQGWQERVKKMKSEKAWWQTLSDEERDEVSDEQWHALQQEYLPRPPIE